MSEIPRQCGQHLLVSTLQLFWSNLSCQEKNSDDCPFILRFFPKRIDQQNFDTEKRWSSRNSDRRSGIVSPAADITAQSVFMMQSANRSVLLWNGQFVWIKTFNLQLAQVNQRLYRVSFFLSIVFFWPASFGSTWWIFHVNPIYLSFILLAVARKQIGECEAWNRTCHTQARLRENPEETCEIQPKSNIFSMNIYVWSIMFLCLFVMFNVSLCSGGAELSRLWRSCQKRIGDKRKNGLHKEGVEGHEDIGADYRQGTSEAILLERIVLDNYPCRPSTSWNQIMSDWGMKIRALLR